MKASLLWICGVTVLALAAGLRADGEKPRTDESPRLLRAWGTVKSVDADAKTLVIVGKTKSEDEPKEITFALADATKIVLPAGEGGRGRAGTLADVTPDCRVTVLYRAAADGAPTALSILLTHAPTK